MRHGTSILLIAAACILAIGCSRKSLPEIGDKKTNFERQTFKKGWSSQGIALVSESECEITDGKENILGEYSRDGDRLRVVVRTSGAPRVLYYKIVPKGLQEESSGEVFLLPRELAAMEAETAKSDPPDGICRRLINDWLAELKQGGTGVSFWIYSGPSDEIARMPRVVSWKILSNLTEDYNRNGPQHKYLIAVDSGSGSPQEYLVQVTKHDQPSWKLWRVLPYYE